MLPPPTFLLRRDTGRRRLGFGVGGQQGHRSAIGKVGVGHSTQRYLGTRPLSLSPDSCQWGKSLLSLASP